MINYFINIDEDVEMNKEDEHEEKDEENME